MKLPFGGADPLSPQHPMEPSVLIPQTPTLPTLTDTKLPEGGGVLSVAASSLPQHAMEPLGLTPQLKSNPALMEVNSPSGEGY